MTPLNFISVSVFSVWKLLAHRKAKMQDLCDGNWAVEQVAQRAAFPRDIQKLSEYSPG